MRLPWHKPHISRLAITRNYSEEIKITMKKLILISLAAIMFAIPAVVFYTSAGMVKMNTLTLKQNGATLSVRPTGVVIKPQ